MRARRIGLGVAVGLVTGLAGTGVAAGAVTIERTSAANTAEGDTAVFTVTRDAVPGGGTATVVVTLEGVTCDEDVTLGTGCTVSFDLPEAGGAQPVTVATIDDDLYEPDEVLDARIAVTGDTGTDGTATTTLVDGDDPPVLSVADTTATEGSPLTFTVSKVGRTALPARATWTATPGPGADAADLGSPTTGQVEIPAGATSVTIAVATADDAIDEPDETVTVTLTAPVDAVLGDGSAIGTILDDDPTPPPPPGPPAEDPPPPPPPPPAPAPSPAAPDAAAQSSPVAPVDLTLPAARMAGLKLKGNTLSVRFACPASERLCRATLTVATVPDAKAKDKRLRRSLTLGSRVAVLPGGTKATFTLALKTSRRALLRKVRSFEARATAVVHDAAGNVGTATAKARLRLR